MIRIVLLDGPFAGQVRSSADVAQAGCQPVDLLDDIARHGWDWKILWPEHPEQPQSWVADWVTGVVASIRDEHGIDLAELASDDRPDAAEIAVWAQAEMTVRIVRAVMSGRAVRFMGSRWQTPADDQQAGTRIVGEIEDAIVGSGRYVMLLPDDSKNDLVIGVGEPEHPQPS
jgi:hypothetical protein